VEETEALRPKARAAYVRQWSALGIPMGDNLDKMVDRDLHGRAHVRRKLTLHALTKMLPPAERVLAKARKDLDDLRRVTAGLVGAS
jgi:hypothetical protein